MRNDAIVKANDKDRAEFKSLGGVECEQGGRVGVCDRILIGDERDVFEKVIERAIGVFERETF